MKKDISPRDLINEIVEYDPDIWNNPSKWKKKEYHMFDLYLYYCGLSFFQRLTTVRKLKKAAKRKKYE